MARYYGRRSYRRSYKPYKPRYTPRYYRPKYKAAISTYRRYGKSKKKSAIKTLNDASKFMQKALNKASRQKQYKGVSPVLRALKADMAVIKKINTKSNLKKSTKLLYASAATDVGARPAGYNGPVGIATTTPSADVLAYMAKYPHTATLNGMDPSV